MSQEDSSLHYRSDDAQLFYVEQGAGAPLVLLHPTPLHHAFWMPMAGLLAECYRVVMPDLRGHGQSEAGHGPITMEKLGADIERLLDELRIDRAIFAGCSIGGYTLYELWRRCPQRVRAMAFCSSKPQADTAQNRATRLTNIEKIRQRGSGEFIEAMLASLIGPSTQSRWPQKIAEAREMMQLMRPEAIIAVQQGLASRPDSVQTAKRITAPCCVVAAGEDGGSTPADMWLLADAIRSGGARVEYHEVPDAGHYAPWEQPETVGRMLRSFFEGLR
jgi:pimeloyl-ACP methyl ester carboxylesterase